MSVKTTAQVGSESNTKHLFEWSHAKMPIPNASMGAIITASKSMR